MLKLPQVSLVVVETLAHDLAKKAIEDSLSHVEFGDILIFSDQDFKVPGARHFQVKNWQTKKQWCEFASYGVSEPVKTSHLLMMEWDSGVIDPSQWTDEFLRYDCIGAPWWYDDGYNVGNGGFTLRSKALMDFWSKHQERFVIEGQYSDDQLCRQYRSAFEAEGDFVWAPNEVAFQFAFERTRPSLQSKHFGYHGMFNWPVVFSPEQLKERMHMASQNRYIKGCSMYNETLNLVPWLRSELAA